MKISELIPPKPIQPKPAKPLKPPKPSFMPWDKFADQAMKQGKKKAKKVFDALKKDEQKNQ